MSGGFDRRRAIQLFGGLGAAGMLSACGTFAGSGSSAGRAEPDEVRIGLLVPGTGGFKPIGDDMINGFEHYLTTNGDLLGGHPVRALRVNEGDSPDSALDALEQLFDQDVHAIIGVASSAAMLPVSDRIEEEHVPLLGANASPSALHGTPHVWRTSFVNHEPGYALGLHLAGQVDGPVAVIVQDDPLGADSVAGLEEAFAEAHASDHLTEPIVTPVVTQPSADHFAVPLDQVQAMDPVAVFACYAGTAAVEFVQQYLAAGLDPQQLYGPAHLTEGVVLAALDDDALGVRTAASYAPELRTAANRAFATDYRRDFGAAPTIYAVAAYDAAAALDKAIALSDGHIAPQHINLNLARIGQLDSPRGRWQFNQGRTPTQKWYLRQVNRDGPVLSNMVLRELGTLG